jgi:hypothetical protein
VRLRGPGRSGGRAGPGVSLRGRRSPGPARTAPGPTR